VISRLRIAATALAVAAMAVLTACSSGGRPVPAGPPAVRGADVSSTLAEEAAGTTLSSDGRIQPIEQILAAAGANYVRLRVWVDPLAGDNDEETALTLARRAHAAGLKIFLDLSYSDWWTDTTRQAPPKAWAGQTPSQLTRTVRSYTQHVLADFARQGTPVSMVEIGNEIDRGILWPDGRVGPDGRGNWSMLARFVNAGIAGARAADPSVRIVLHVSVGSDHRAAVSFFDHLTAAGVHDFDVIGLSYYAYWQRSLDALGDTMDGLARRYHRPVLIAETDYPWTLSGNPADRWVTDRAQLPDAKRFPPTPAGQAAFFVALRRVISEVPDGRGLGLIDWEPGWLPGVSAGPGQSDAAFSNLTMFDTRGRALPSLDVAFRP
jgi:arabinogalactan endo-1,4-beta-galactosidase